LDKFRNFTDKKHFKARTTAVPKIELAALLSRDEQKLFWNRD